MFENPVANREDALHAFSKWDEMLALISADERSTMTTWIESVPPQLKTSLAKTHLQRDGNLLVLNLDSEMVEILREMKYLKWLNLEQICPEAVELFARNEVLETCFLRLDRIVEWYNHLKLETIDEEKNLIKAQMEEIDLMLVDITDTLTWETDSKYFGFLGVYIARIIKYFNLQVLK